MTVVALDTNILLRLVHTNAPEHADCRNAVRKLTEIGCTFAIATQIAVEFWVVATRPVNVNGLGWLPVMARAKLDQILTMVSVLPDSPQPFATWLDLVTTLPVSGKRAHDARIASTLRANGVRHLLTLNAADFAGMPDPPRAG
ncbi:MAG: hypothetical protein JOZ69_25210 [Myxococcales bacterium]|nr:hypothetical protein [Myxococcales bacterium]